MQTGRPERASGAPEADIYVWSDMFTPYHNARPFDARDAYYYLVDGNWDGAWEGLPSDVIIMNWYSPDREAAKWFSDRGHSQLIAGYYDGDSTEDLKENISRWMEVTEGLPDILGFMYTTWGANYDWLEEYFQLVESWPEWKEKAAGEASPE